MPPAISSWIMSFLTGRTQKVKCGFQLSSPKPINRDIVQGSGHSPTLYIIIIIESDLKALSRSNLLFKYAYDTSLVPEVTDVDINDEYNNVLKWAADPYDCSRPRYDL